MNTATDDGMIKKKMQPAAVNYSQSIIPTPPTTLAIPGQLAKAQPGKDKFETNSTVWADTWNPRSNQSEYIQDQKSSHEQVHRPIN